MTLHCCLVYNSQERTLYTMCAKGSFGQKYLYLYINCRYEAAHGIHSHAEIETKLFH